MVMLSKRSLAFLFHPSVVTSKQFIFQNTSSLFFRGNGKLAQIYTAHRPYRIRESFFPPAVTQKIFVETGIFNFCLLCQLRDEIYGSRLGPLRDLPPRSPPNTEMETWNGKSIGECLLKTFMVQNFPRHLIKDGIPPFTTNPKCP